jgi:cobalt/nickel transport system permease protein
MYQIDKISYNSPFTRVHPGEKASFSLISLMMVLLSSSFVLPAFIFVIMWLLLCIKGKLPLLILFKLAALPLLFIISAVLPILISISTEPFTGAKGVAGGWFYWGISEENIHYSLLLMSRSLSAVMCFLFFILTTPIGQIDSILTKLRVSPVFREMLILIYRFIFILSDFSSEIYASQKARLGYSSFTNSFKSLGQLIRAVFRKSEVYSDQAALALQARSCTGEICFIQNPVTGSKRNRVLIALFFIFIISIHILEGKWPI